MQQALYVRLTETTAKAAALCRNNWLHMQCCGPARAPGERQQPCALLLLLPFKAHARAKLGSWASAHPSLTYDCSFEANCWR